MNLSIAIATFNEQDNLDQCLKSVSDWSDEIVIVDGGSTDNTVEIANKFNSKIIISDNPEIFHINKQKSLNACHGTWILQLDADEVVPSQLRDEILSITNPKTGSKNFSGYYIARKNYFLGFWMKKGGLYPDYVIRLFKNSKGSFPSKSVHEQIKIEGGVGYLKNPLLHNTAPTLTTYWLKANRYISLETQVMIKNSVPKNLFTYITYIFIKPLTVFINLSLRHKGIYDGWRGLLFAYFSALQPLLAYIRYLTNKF